MTKRAVFPNRPTRQLAARAQLVLGMTHRQYGDALGVSERTVQRWASSGGGMLVVEQLRTLAALVHPKDAALAAEMAEAASESLESLGIVAPLPPVNGRSSPLNPEGLTEAVVCAMADEMSAVPSSVRGALLVTFRTALKHGLTLEDMERVLAARLAQKKPKA